MIFLCFLAFVSTFFLAASECPPPEVVAPCYCQGNWATTITCNGTSTQKLDLKETLKRVSGNAKSQSQRSFYSLQITSSNITEIPFNVTGDLIFNMIEIQAPNLTRIHSQAFVSRRALTLYVGNRNRKLENVDGPYNSFDLINSIKFQVIYFLAPKVNQIPANAFKPNKYLRLVSFGHFLINNSRLSIGDNAFSSVDLSTLYLNGNRINYLSKDALQTQNNSASIYPLSLFLSHNELNSSSFAPGSLAGFGKKTILRLDYNHISYLDEAIFKPFFESQEGNDIESLLGNPINCTDCRNAWLAKNQDKYKIWVGEAHCHGESDKPTIFDQKFEHCK